MNLNAIILFNTIDFLPKQVELLRKNTEGDICVVDNSNNYHIAKEVRKWCNENKIDYLKTAVNEADFSKSHSYACKVIIEMARMDYDSIFILDHDIFPTKKIDLEKYKSYLLAGNPQLRPGVRTRHEGEAIVWKYYWPGCLFINLHLLHGQEIELAPCLTRDNTYLDTGGSLYKIIMGNPDRCFDFKEYHVEDYAMIEDWMHFIKGSNWHNDHPEEHRQRIERLMKTLNEKLC